MIGKFNLAYLKSLIEFGGQVQSIDLLVIKDNKTHAQRSEAGGALLVSEWKSAAFWPLLFTDGASSAWFVREVRVLDKDRLVARAGRNRANLFKHKPNTNVLALRVRFQK